MVPIITELSSQVVLLFTKDQWIKQSILGAMKVITFITLPVKNDINRHQIIASGKNQDEESPCQNTASEAD